MNFPGRARPDVAWVQIEKALRNGEFVRERTDVKIVFEGAASRLVTFEGLRHIARGQLSFYHHGSRVMSVDFDRDMITDFGYTGYSLTTNRNLAGWTHALQDAWFLNVQCLVPHVSPFEWTISDTHNQTSPFRRGAGHANAMRDRFLRGAPWVKRFDGVPWFHGPSYDEALHCRFNDLATEIVRDGVSWHWWTADWVNGRWTKVFINDDARKRWERREAKLAKAAA